MRSSKFNLYINVFDICSSPIWSGASEAEEALILR